MSKLYALYEHCVGFALFQVAEFEELAAFLPQVEESVTDLQRFNSVVTLIRFQPFKSVINALEFSNAVSEGIIPEDLNLFLEGSLPKRKKRSKCTLGVADAKLGAAISEALEIPCSHVGAVPEILRGIRHHFHALTMGLTLKACSVAQLALEHSYSRARVKFNVHRVDNMVIQSIALLDQLDKDVNTFSMRIREWYSCHFPELVAIVPENYLYTKCAEYIKDRKSLSEESLEPLTEILGDSEKAQAILDASKMSMGMDISPMDLINIQLFAVRVVQLIDYRKQVAEYLHTKMRSVAPTLATLVGDQVGARLISRAGSLTSLAKYPASTLQIQGVEKALFGALKTRSNTPKYGLLYHSTFIGRVGLKNKGRISRCLANKCSIAATIDCFSETQTTIFGEKLRQQVEDRLKFYETGDIQKKNIEVMEEAMEEALNATQELDTSVKKKKKKKKNIEVMEEAMEEALNATQELDTSVKKKKKKKKNIEVMEEAMEEALNATQELDTSVKKKKKKKKNIEVMEEAMEEALNATQELDTSVKKKKKKKKNIEVMEEAMEEALNATQELDTSVKKKKKKKKNIEVMEEAMEEALNATQELDTSVKKKKKKKKNIEVMEEAMEEALNATQELDTSVKKKKKKKKNIEVMEEAMEEALNATQELDTSVKKKKKKKKNIEVMEEAMEEALNATQELDTSVKKKKKKKKNIEVMEEAMEEALNATQELDTSVKKKKKKKKNIEVMEEAMEEALNATQELDTSVKKKKKKKKNIEVMEEAMEEALNATQELDTSVKKKQEAMDED